MRSVMAAGLVLLTAACTAPPPATPGTRSQASREPARTGTPTPSQTPGTAAELPEPPAPAAVPVRAVPACARTACRATAVVPNAHTGIHLALIRGPDSDATQTAYLLSLDTAGRPLAWRRVARGDVFFDPLLPAPRCDRYVHCFVVAGVGAHGGVMNVFAVDAAGRLADVSPDGELATDTPDLSAADLDGDGVAEVLGLENDYEPSYVEGSRFWLVWSWQGDRYVLTGCRVAQRGEQGPGGPVSPAACPG